MPGVARLASTWLPPLAWMAVIFAFSSRHGGGHLSAAEVVLRKLAHVVEYLVLAVLLLRALRRSDVAAALPVAIAAALAYAASDEWHQSFVPGRTATPRDVAIDGVGIALAVIVATRTRLRERIA
jgi:VanZ family protein